MQLVGTIVVHRILKNEGCVTTVQQRDPDGLLAHGMVRRGLADCGPLCARTSANFYHGNRDFIAENGTEIFCLPLSTPHVSKLHRFPPCIGFTRKAIMPPVSRGEVTVSDNPVHESLQFGTRASFISDDTREPGLRRDLPSTWMLQHVHA